MLLSDPSKTLNSNLTWQQLKSLKSGSFEYYKNTVLILFQENKDNVDLRDDLIHAI